MLYLMWLGLVVYFALVGLRVFLNYQSLRRYLKLPLVERPKPVDEAPSSATLELPAGLVAEDAEWLLFSPSRASHEPRALDLMVRFALQHEEKAVSMILQERCETPWEQLLLPFVAQQCFISPRYARRSAGHELLLERSVYSAFSGQLPESVDALRALVGAKGIQPLVARAERLGEVRSFETTELRHGAGRRLRAGGLSTVLGLLLSILAIPCAIYGLATGSIQFGLAALVTWLTSATEMALWQLILKAPFRWSLLQPVASVLAWAALFRAPLSGPGSTTTPVGRTTDGLGRRP